MMKRLWQQIIERIGFLLRRDFKWLLLMLCWFLGFSFLGAWIPQHFPWFSKEFMGNIMKNFSELVARMQSTGTFGQILIILGNNISVAITVIVSGFLMLPFLPLIFLIVNSLMIGMLYHYIQAEIPLAQFCISLIPHGIFEIPAFLIAVFLGLKISLIPYRLWINYLNGKENRALFREYFAEFPYYFLLIACLLVIAAIIEITVSALLV